MDPATGVTTPTNSGTALGKFVDSLAGLGLPGCVSGNPLAANPCHENNLGNYISIATADTATFTGSDYYVIGIADYQQKMHSNLLAPSDALGTGVKLRGYHEIIGGVAQPNHYLGPVILATKDKPVRILFKNTLGPSNTTGKLFIPVDPTVMGMGNGPDGQPYAENRAAGEAAGYLLVDPQDPQESVMLAAGTLPNICNPGVNGGLCAYIYGIPLVIQDKTFVPANVGGTTSINRRSGYIVEHGRLGVRGQSLVPAHLRDRPGYGGSRRIEPGGKMGLRPLGLAADTGDKPDTTAGVPYAGSVYGHAHRERHRLSLSAGGKESLSVPHSERRQ
jgi:hypothetical protein